MFVSAHYAGNDLVPKFQQGEFWKKVYGPVFVYLNKNDGLDPLALWNDAKMQVCAESCQLYTCGEKKYEFVYFFSDVD